MDEIVRQGLAKWPNVPDCYGWLALDGRGRWRIGHERQPITHAATNQFIARNYLHDETGRWLFQNGPQRVYVTLEYTPFVFRVHPEGATAILMDHCMNRAAAPDALWMDDGGRFVVRCDERVGVIHDHDSALVLNLMRDAQGRPLSDAALERLVDTAGHAPVAEAAEFQLEWPGSERALPLETLLRTDVAVRFGFVAQPETRPTGETLP